MKYINYVIYALSMILIISNCHQTAPIVPDNESPIAPVNIFPPNDTTGINIETTFRWQADDPDEKDNLLFDFYLEAGNPDPGLLLSGLKADSVYRNDLKYDTTYYWKVVAKDQEGDTTNSPIWFFKTRHEFNSPPNTPWNPAPANEANSIPINGIVLKWQGGDPDYYSIVNYDVLFGESSDSLITVSDSQADSAFPLTLLKYDTKYYWKIVAKDDYNNIAEGPVWNFETLLPEILFSGSFDADTPNETPSSLKWTVWRDTLTDIFVTNQVSWDNQGNSACFVDSTIEGSSYLAASVEGKKVGIFQFRFLMTSPDDYFGIRMYSETADSIHIGPQVSIREGKLQYYDNSRTWQAAKPVVNNTWYFLQLVFDCNEQFYNIYVDEKLVAEKITWTGTNVSNLDSFYFLTFENRKCEKAYIDDVKFLSDP